MAAVSIEFAINSAAVTVKVLGYRGHRKTLFSESSHYIPLVRGDLLIRHKSGSLLGGSEKDLVLQIISFINKRVALSI